MLDLCVPPLSLLILTWGALLAMAFVVGAIGGSWLAFELLGPTGGLVVLSIGAAWLRFGRKDYPLATLLAAPLYVLRKVPLYVDFLARRRQRDWVRTEREPDGRSKGAPPQGKA